MKKAKLREMLAKQEKEKIKVKPAKKKVSKKQKDKQ